MNDEAQKYLAELLAKSPVELTEEQMAFIKARRSYLTEEQLINFGLVEEASGAEKPSPYADLGLKELRAEAENRGLEIKANVKKADLIFLLEANDRVSESPEEATEDAE